MTTSATANTIAQYTKSIAALVAAVATSLLTIFGDGDVARILTVTIAVAGVLAVYRFPNADDPETAAAKEIVHSGELLPADPYADGYTAAVDADDAV